MTRQCLEVKGILEWTIRSEEHWLAISWAYMSLEIRQ